MTAEELESLVKKHVSELGEHFTSVRIFVTAEHPDNGQISRSYNNGCGQWFASPLPLQPKAILGRRLVLAPGSPLQLLAYWG